MKKNQITRLSDISLMKKVERMLYKDVFDFHNSISIYEFINKKNINFSDEFMENLFGNLLKIEKFNNKLLIRYEELKENDILLENHLIFEMVKLILLKKITFSDEEIKNFFLLALKIYSEKSIYYNKYKTINYINALKNIKQEINNLQKTIDVKDIKFQFVFQIVNMQLKKEFDFFHHNIIPIKIKDCMEFMNLLNKPYKHSK